MKKVLVMGITGGFGGHVAEVLLERGWSVRALVRDPLKLPQRLLGVEVVKGDAADIDSIRAAAEGVDLLVYGVNPPGYRWEGTVLPWLDNMARVAEEKRLTIVFPGNVYVFDPADGPEFAEDAPARPISSRGRLRMAMEQRLHQATERGARVVIVRGGDFIGKYANSAWMGQLIKRTKRGYVLSAAGPRDLPHTWAYLPDMARLVADVVAKQNQLPAYSTFHFEGYRLTFDGIAQAIAAASGDPVITKAFPWWFLRLIAPFYGLFEGLLEMRYLWETEINLREEKLRGMVEVRQTPFVDALVESGLVRKGRASAMRQIDLSINSTKKV